MPIMASVGQVVSLKLMVDHEAGVLQTFPSFSPPSFFPFPSHYNSMLPRKPRCFDLAYTLIYNLSYQHAAMHKQI